MDKTNNKPKLLAVGGVALAVLVLLVVLLLTRCGGGMITASMDGGELTELLAAEGNQTIQVDGDVVLEGPVVVNGNKTIQGEGTIILNTPLEGQWPKTDVPTWGMGCADIAVEDAQAMPAAITVSNGAKLTLGEGVVVDAGNNANGILVQQRAELTVSGQSGISNGRYANLVICDGAEVQINGGELLDGNVHNIINYGKLDLVDGNISGAKAGAAIYTAGELTQSGGSVSGAAFHNVFVAAGTMTMTGGTNTEAAKDGIRVAEGAVADVTGGTIMLCNHGLCNDGKLTAGAVMLNECGIMNYETGIMDLKGTTVDTSEVYCLANSGGTVNAVDFTAARCDTCAIYNFSGDMNFTNLTVTGSRDGNVANAGGNMTIDGATLDVCRDKSITVGNGKAVMKNVTINGTTGDKYGIYAYGGELELSDSSIADVSSTAVKVDAGSTVTLTNVTIKDVAQNGFQAVGGRIVATNVTMENMGSHGIYNQDGEVEVNGLTIKGVKKNAVQQKDGTTTITGLTAENMGNHGAYVEAGTLTIEDGTIKTMEGNGFYIVKGDNKLVLKNVSISDIVQQGINNESVVELTNVSISNAGKNGIYNKVGASATINGLNVANVAEHGINNKAQMSASGVTIANTGKGSNGIQNNGTLTLNGATIANSQNHGLYNAGQLTAANISVNVTAQNGLYNDGGTATVTGLSVTNAGDQGVNNNATITISDAKINGTTQNGVYNSKGTAKIDKLTVSATGGHGVSNAATMTLTGAEITGTGGGKNGIQNTGTLTVGGVTITDSKNHGIYNSASLNGSGVTISNTDDNGLYNDGGTIGSLSGLSVTNAGGQGVNNNSTMTLSDVTVSGTGKNGVYNNGGTATVSELKVSNVGEHGVSNQGTMSITNATLDGSGVGSNCIQNKGDLTVANVTAQNSKNHGVYNDSGFTATGELVITGAAVTGLYNYGGNADITTMKITTTGSHGLNNAGTMTVQNVSVSASAENGIQNSGSLQVTGYAYISGAGKHGVYNGNQLNGNNITVASAGDLLLSNAGNMEIHGLNLGGYANKAVYNAGYAELYNATIDGTNVTNGGNAEYLVDNNGGTLDLTNATLVNANGTSLQNRGRAFSALTNVIIDGAGNYGIFVEAGSTVSGDGVVVNNITKNTAVNGAEGYAIKNQGTITMMDHVTLGDYDDAVTGDGKTARKSTSGIATTALTNDSTTASYSGYDLTIKNASNGQAIYNKGVLYVTDLYAEDVKDAIVTRYTSWVTLSGNVTLKDVSRNPVSTYGVESGSYVNGITLTSGTNMVIENVGSHAINNKGSFLAAADSSLIIRNVKGQNINAINNNGGNMTLGNVTIDGVYVTVSMYNDTTINSNSGNAIQTNSTMEINGNVIIGGIFYKPANNKTDNSNGSGVVVKNGGKITGTGSITIIGNQTAPEGYEGYMGMFNGILLSKGIIELSGDVSVSNVKNQGIYLGDEKTGDTLKANNITVSGVVSGNGIYARFKTSKVETTGNVDISATGQNAITNAGTFHVGGNINIHDITSGYNGLRNDGSGNMNVTGDVVITNISGTTADKGRGNALTSNGKVTVGGNVTISGVTTSGNTDNTSNNAINGSGVITVGGNVTVTDAVAAGHGAFLDQGKLLVTGNIEINGTGAGKQGLYGANESKDSAGAITKFAEIKAANITVRNSGGNGIYINKNSGKVTVTGAILIDGAAQHGINNVGTVNAGSITINNACPTGTNNGINNNGGAVTVTGAVTVNGVGGHGVSNNKNFTAASVTVTNPGKNGGNGIQNSGSGNMTIYGAVNISNVINGHAIYNAKTVSFGSFTSVDTSKNGINNGGTFTVAGELSVTNAGGDAIANSKTLTAGSITVDTGVKNGINNSGTFTVNGLTTVKNITGSDINAIHNKNTMTLGDVVIDGVKVKIGTDTKEVDGVETTTDKVNVGNGIFNEKTLVLNGTANITNVFTDKKGNTVGAGFCQSATGTTTGTGSMIVTGTASTDTAYPYGINNGIFLDGSSLNLSGDITVTNVTNQGIYVANDNAALTAKNITVTDVAGNGIYVNKATGALTTTGTITVTNAALHGINNVGTMNTGAIVLENITKNGINSTGAITIASGDVTVTGAGDTGIASNGVFYAPNSTLTVNTVTNQGVAIKAEMTVKGITVTNSNGHGVVVNNKNTIMNVSGTIRVDGFTKRGISNTQAGGEIKAGNIVVTNGTSANIDAGIKNGNATAKITVTGDMTVSNVGGTTTAADVGNGITNTGIITVGGTLKVENTTSGASGKDSANCGIWNKAGTIKANTLIVDGVANRCGIYLNGGTMEAVNLTVQNVRNYVGIYMDSTATLRAETATVSNINHQGIQAQHANTIEIGTLTLSKIAKNGLRLYNNNSNPTVTITDLIASDVTEYALAAQKAITSDDLSIGTVYYVNCGKGAVHGNIKSGVGEIKNELPAAQNEEPVADPESIDPSSEAPASEEGGEPDQTT